MKRLQFHSELTCDEVWYRMNVLLQSFAVRGAKRYEVYGELTEWGCRLWLRGPDGCGGTPLPLRLWTEEGQGAGCEIVCTFRPTWREAWSVAAAGAGFCLELFLIELVSGVPLFQALGTGLLGGCAAGAAVYGLFFALLRLFFRKRERELLQWIETYLLLRELEGVLLPDLEAQKAGWTGLPMREKTPRGRRFKFRCPLPPEELPAALERWSSRQNLRQEGREVKWSVRRQGRNRVKLLRTETEEGRREGVQTGGGSLSYSFGRYKTWQFAEPFWGIVEPDGQGGSVLRGAFVPHRLFLGLQLAVLLTVCCCALFLPLRLALPLTLAAAVFCVLPVLKNPLNNPGSRMILEFLQTYLEEI